MRDDFSEETKRAIAARSGYICANPKCMAPTSGPQLDLSKALNVGVAAHITGASVGGARFNPALSSDERRRADNGIWLCQTCAKLIDNDASQFPEEYLRAWKTIAEHEAFNSIGKTARPVAESEAQRKLRVIRPWRGQEITLHRLYESEAAMRLGLIESSPRVQLIDCTEHNVTVGKPGAGGWSKGIPLAKIEICCSDPDRLELETPRW